MTYRIEITISGVEEAEVARNVAIWLQRYLTGGTFALTDDDIVSVEVVKPLAGVAA